MLKSLLNPQIDNDEIKLAKIELELYRLSMDSEERERYNMREKAIYDKISALENAEEKGKKEGKIQIAKNLLLAKVELDVIMQSTGLSREEIEGLK